jgi:hypothetical protein
LATFGNFWQLLGNFGKLWQRLATFGQFSFLFFQFKIDKNFMQYSVEAPPVVL